MQRTVRIIAAILCMLMPAIAHAETVGACTDTPLNDFEKAVISERPSPITILPSLKDIASHDGAELSVTTYSGTNICIRTAWMSSLQEMTLSNDERFLGFHYYAMEADGYILIDRAGSGTILETGNRPLFNKDRNYFMAAQKSGAGWGNLEGIAVWQVHKDNTKRVFFRELPEASNYRIRYFDDSGCAYIQSEYDAANQPYGQSEFTLSFGETIELAEGNSFDFCAGTQFRQNRGSSAWAGIHEGRESGPPEYGFTITFADKASLRDTGSYKALSISQLIMSSRKVDGKTKETITDLRLDLLIDCDASRYKVTEVSEYDEYEQLIMSAVTQFEIAEWLPPLPETGIEKALAMACKGNFKDSFRDIPQGMTPLKWLLAYSRADWSK